MASKSEYLKKYISDTPTNEHKKVKKKKQVHKSKSTGQAINIFDDDPNYEWGKPDEPPVAPSEFEPAIVTENEELLEQYQQVRKMGEEGSGWTAVEIDESVIDAINNVHSLSDIKMKLLSKVNKESNKIEKNERSNNDASPPRKRRRDDSPKRSISPERNQLHNSSISNDSPTEKSENADASPPRKKKVRHDSPVRNSSPPKRHDSPPPAIDKLIREKKCK